MAEMKSKKKQHGNFKVRSALLALQILLPFGLYLALVRENAPGAWVEAAVFTISMVVLVWMG